MFFKTPCSTAGASWDFGSFGLKHHMQDPVFFVTTVIRKFPCNSCIFLLTYFYTVFLHRAANLELLYLSANTFGRFSMF